MRGGIDKISDNSIYGWACQSQNVDAVDISIYVGGDIQQGTLLTRMQTNSRSTWFVRGNCAYTSYKHGFHYTFTPEQQFLYYGQPIYVYVHEPVTDNPVLLQRSFLHTMPTRSSDEVVLFEDHFDGVNRSSQRGIQWSSAAHASHSSPNVFEIGSGQLKTNYHIYVVPDHDFSNTDDTLHPDTTELRLKANLSGYKDNYTYYFALGAPEIDDPNDYSNYDYRFKTNIELQVDTRNAFINLRGIRGQFLGGRAIINDPKTFTLSTVELRIKGDFSQDQSTVLASVYINDDLLMSDISFTWYSGQNHLVLYANDWGTDNDPLPVRFDAVRLTAVRNSQSCPVN